jgi:hypothetical protein
MVSEEDSAFSHGRIPAHEVRAAMETSSILLKAKSGAAQHHARLMLYGCDPVFQQSTISTACRSYMEMISDHFMSYNTFSRTSIFIINPE